MSVNADEAAKMIKQNENNPRFKVIDVRTGLERTISSIPNSDHIPLSDIQSRLNQFSKDNTYLIYCRSGARSQTATNTLKQNGINAINLTGGMNNWQGQTSGCLIY